MPENIKNLPWACPRCHRLLGGSQLSQSSARRRQDRHVCSQALDRSKLNGLNVGLQGSQLPHLSPETLPFELLPQGSWSVQHVLDYYGRSDVKKWRGSRTLDRNRLLGLGSLHPTRCYVGKKMWLGYVAFEFERYGAAILECPFDGNATYVLFGQWRLMLHECKRSLLTKYARFTTKVVHRGDWLHRVTAVLKRS